jgi:hypothetical protein
MELSFTLAQPMSVGITPYIYSYPYIYIYIYIYDLLYVAMEENITVPTKLHTVIKATK